MLAGAVLLLVPERVSAAAAGLVFVLVFLAASTGGFAFAAGWMRAGT
ncbi:hypothetical protein ACFQ6N_28545 [Kitasatospora sp. NPDC056446]